jgi:ATP-binding protein involved in chromosome partitioning
MSISKSTVTSALGTVQHPRTGQDLVATGAVAKVTACDGHAAVVLVLDDLPEPERAAVRAAADRAIREHAARAGETLAGLAVQAAGESASAARTVSLPVQSSASPKPAPAKSAPPSAAQAQQAAPQLPGVKHVIAVGAGKGGVGKSTVAVNLAVGLARRGHAVGLLDGDIYGPSLPTMLGLHDKEVAILRNMLQPFLVHGIKGMTIGKLVDPEKALIWRGPMAHGAFKQLVEQTEWGELDYLIIDLPPGTGDVSLTMAQLLRLTGAVIVCTPQRVAQDDAVRAVRMFQQLGVDILGVVENMSYFIGDDGKEYDLFGRGGAEIMAQRLGVPFLGAVPINTALRRNGDTGDASANFDPQHAGQTLVTALEKMVHTAEGQIALAAMRSGQRTPTLSIS